MSTDTHHQVEDLFDQADQLLFTEHQYDQAQRLYESILQLDSENTDALNSIAYCVKFRAGQDLAGATEELLGLYKKVWAIDEHDIEANFNAGLLYLQLEKDLPQALHYFERSVLKDCDTYPKAELMRAQFAKAYYNIGMILDRQDKPKEAAVRYKQALDKCEGDPDNMLVNSATYKKAGTNYAVALEKTGVRKDALDWLQRLGKQFGEEVRFSNNIGILQMRNGQTDKAAESYKHALEKEPNSFFPNYNYGVLLASQAYYKDAVSYFMTALEALTDKTVDYTPHAVNTLLNLATCHEQQKRFVKASELLKQALSHDPVNKEAQTRLTQVEEILEKQRQGAQEPSHRQDTKQQLINKERLKIDLAKAAAESARQPASSHHEVDRQSQKSEHVDAEVERQLDELPPSQPLAVEQNPEDIINSPRVDELTSEHSIANEPHLAWTRQQCNENLNSTDKDTKVRAYYRLGWLDQEQGQFQSALDNYKQARSLDPTFQQDFINLRIAQVCYKLGFIDQASQSLEICEKVMEKDRLSIHLLRGKCEDKKRHYTWAVKQYECALHLCKEMKLDERIVGEILFRKGHSQIRSKKNIDLGINDMKAAAAILPENTEILMKLSNAIFQNHPAGKENDDLLFTYLNRVCQLEPRQSGDALVLIGKLYHRQQNYIEAISKFDQAVHMKSDSTHCATCYFYKGLCQEKMKDFKNAMLNYKRSLTSDSNHFGSCIHLAKLLFTLKEFPRSIKYYRHAIKIDADNVQAQYGLANAIQKYSSNKEECIAYYQEVLKREPDHYRAITQLGILYLDLKQYQKCAEQLKVALKINAYYPKALVTMGELLFKTGNGEQAIKFFNQALKFEQNDIAAIIGLGNVYYQMEDSDNAIKYFRMAIQINNENPDVHYNLGNSYYLAEKVDQAIYHYEQSVQQDPNKPETYYNLGNAYCSKTQYQQAIGAYTLTLNLDPRNSQAFYNLGNALYMINSFEAAIKAYLQSLEYNPNSPECMFNLASAFSDVEDYKNAIKYFQKAIEHDKDNVEAITCLAQVYEVADKKYFRKAAELYERLIVMQPNVEKHKTRLTALRKELADQQANNEQVDELNQDELINKSN